jgi:3-deoxy-D-manno-octulosonic acid hydroxylase-like protein
MKSETMTFAEAATAEILELDEQVDLADTEIRARVRDALEAGNLVFLKGRGFALTGRERAIITDSRIMSRGNEERSKRNGRPTLTFDVGSDRLLFSTIRTPEKREIEAMLRRYSEWSRNLLRTMVPEFAQACEQNRIIYRPVERNRVQGLHVDSTYLYPTQGRAKLRIFCNIDPKGRPRVWEIGERFENFAQRYLPLVRAERGWFQTALDRFASLVGVVKGRRTEYDHLLESIRSRGKSDRDYQKSAPRRIVSFPAGSAWIGLTDVVLHGGISGQHALDQVFFVPPEAMRNPSRSALGILERLSGHTLT